MGVLDQIKQMQNQGISDDEIVTRLHEQGVSPKEINDALNQSQIKRAVADERYGSSGQNPPSPDQQSQENYFPQTQETPEYSGQENYPQQQEYIQPQEGYQQEGYGYQTGGSDTDTIIEIAEQVFSEKIKKIQKQVDITNEFRTLAQNKIDNLSERLKKIESMIDKLQMTILGEIGSYGDNLESIKKEMSMMQDSFGKVVNQAVRGYKPSETTSTKKKISKK